LEIPPQCTMKTKMGRQNVTKIQATLRRFFEKFYCQCPFALQCSFDVIWFLIAGKSRQRESRLVLS
jgi:hypothetical protein